MANRAGGGGAVLNSLLAGMMANTGAGTGALLPAPHVAPDTLLADNLGTAFGLGAPYNPFVGGQLHHHHPHQHQQQRQQQQQQAQPHAQVQLPPNANATPAPTNVHAIHRFFNHNHGGSTSNALALANQATALVDDAFIHRFIALHHSTLRKFWVVGMRCSEDAIRTLCARCEKLERVRAEDVDEFPVRCVFLAFSWSIVAIRRCTNGGRLRVLVDTAPVED